MKEINESEAGLQGVLPKKACGWKLSENISSREYFSALLCRRSKEDKLSVAEVTKMKKEIAVAILFLGGVVGLGSKSARARRAEVTTVLDYKE